VARPVALRRRAATVISLLLLLATLPAAVSSQDAERPKIDGSIREADLQHDSRDDLYRAPVGAVTAGTPVHVRLRAAAGDLSGAELRLVDRLSGASWAQPMEMVARDPDGGDAGYDYWQTVVETGPQPGIIDYSIVAQDGAASRVLSDDRAGDGGSGIIGRSGDIADPWQITAYDPDFETPAWAPGSVVYQVFPDRCANADQSNDPSPDASPGPSGADAYRHGQVHGVSIINKSWDELPEAHCRDYRPEPCDEEAYNRDFFGGDLAGVTAALDGLADLGVTVIYLNPIFAAPSNHRYDTSDYFYVDPDLGTADDYATLLAEARARGIRVVLDGVFNHVSADSPWFDRFGNYATVGACESADSEFRDWFTFRPPGPGQPEACAPSVAGGDDTYYASWWNFDSIPELNEIPAVLEEFTGEDGVVETWIERGTAGWRLDVADSMSHPFQAAIRDAAKGADPEAIVIAEQWHDSTPWLLGDQADSTMNYRFRRAVIALVNGATADPDGSLEALTPNGFANAMLAVREDYPPPAYQALMNLVDSHDTARILWTLTPGPDNDAAKTEPTALAEGKTSQRLVAAIQLTFPGMASIYYGDEVGLTGFDDPDDRRPYPWGAEDLELRDWYRTLARLRASHEAVREGDLEFLWADDATRTLAYLRRSPSAAAVVALNLGQRARELRMPVTDRIPDGTLLTDALGGVAPATVADGSITLTLEPGSVAVLVSGNDADLLAPDAPADLVARAGPGRVELAWAPVDGAAGYRVLRSGVTGGGYTPVAEPAEPSFVDETVHDGTPYHYVVAAVDAVGNVSARSAEAMAVPQLTVTGLAVLGVLDTSGAVVDEVERPLSAVDGSVAVEVAVEAAVGTGIDSERVADGVLVEVGIAPEEISAIAGDAWTWSPAEATGLTDRGAIFRGLVQPEEVGGFSAGARASTDGGETWQSALGVGHIDAIAGADNIAPPVPGTPELLDVSGERVRFRWAPVEAVDLYRYLILRSVDGAEEEVIAMSESEVFLDATATAGASYRYRVVAQDRGYNRSQPSVALEVIAEERVVDVTLTVTVPEHTSPDDTIYIAGSFQGWDPGANPMTRVDDSTWAIVLPFTDATGLEYKYTRGSWEAVEKDAGCGEIANRTLTVEYTAGGVQEVADTIERWRDLDGCP
jgi:glycosidase